MVAKCPSIDGNCADGETLWPMTDCGFSTYEGHYTNEGKFNGMRWVGPPPTNTTIEVGPPDDCSQNMCGAPPVKGDLVTPVQLYITWMGTDSDKRDMTSGGLTFEAFQQYSAAEAVSVAVDGAKSLTEKTRQCVTNKQCS